MIRMLFQRKPLPVHRHVPAGLRLFVMLFCMLGTLGLHAQQESGTVLGTITDALGQSVPGQRLHLHPQSGASRSYRLPTNRGSIFLTRWPLAPITSR